MIDVLSAEGLVALDDYLKTRVLLAFDFDGTLAPLTADRERAFMTEASSKLFQAVCARFPCAVVSGRARADVLSRLDGASAQWVVGNHGIEPSPEEAKFERWAQQLRSEIEAELSGLPGVDIEDKRYSLSVHYLHAEDRRKAEEAILAVVRGREGVRVGAGKNVVNLVPSSAPHKGDAILRLAQASDFERVIYVGDDETDEDVFRSKFPFPLLGIRVGHSSTSAASFYLSDQTHIDRLLAHLLKA